jgi:hypothetical protein
LLAAQDAADGRRKQRKRDQTPDTIGLNAKRALLERAICDDPGPTEFEAWLLGCAKEAGALEASAIQAMARAILDEWRLAHTMPEFAAWLERGAPSEDAQMGRGRE